VVFRSTSQIWVGFCLNFRGLREVFHPISPRIERVDDEN